MPEESAQATAPPSFDQAFQSAIASESAPAPEAAVESTEEATQDEQAANQSEEQGTEPAQAQESSEEQLLSPEEYDALKDNPKALMKALNRAYTQHRQAMKPWENVIAAFQKDPDGTIRQLAKERGISVAEAVQQQQQAQQQQVQQDTVALLKQSLGPDLDWLADKLAPAIETLTATKFAPLQQQLTEQAVQRSVESALNAFQAKHPDWQDHQAEMTKYGKILHPADGVSEVEYLESLYALATRSQSNAAQTKKVIDRIKQSAAASESPDSGVSPSRVSSKPTGLPTFEQAAAAALKGERW